MKIRKGNFEIDIDRDESADSPRDWDTLGTMVCFHRRYNLGDKHNFNTPEDFREFMDGTSPESQGMVVLPLYLYDHSGLAISTGNSYPFNCPWDAGQVGWIYVTFEKIKEFMGVSKVTREVVERAERILRSEVKTYNDCLQGNVYGYIIREFSTCTSCGEEKEENIDSCWGFYGNDPEESGILEAINSELPEEFRVTREELL